MLIASMLPAGPPVHFMCDRLAAANSTTRVLSGNVCPFAVAVEVSVNRYGYDVFNLRSASMRSLRASFDGLKELVTRDGLSLLDVAEPLFLLAAEGEEEELPEPLFIRPRLQPTSSVDNVSRIRIELDRSDIWSPYCLYNRSRSSTSSGVCDCRRAISVACEIAIELLDASRNGSPRKYYLEARWWIEGLTGRGPMRNLSIEALGTDRWVHVCVEDHSLFTASALSVVRKRLWLYPHIPAISRRPTT